jgi:hypothetical protein
MRTFEHPNTNDNWVCPICKTNEDKPVTLIGIAGTEEGGNIQAEQFHADCICNLEFGYYKEQGILVSKFD